MAFDRDDPHPETRADFALMEAEPGAMERYWRLAVDMSDYQKRLEAVGVIQGRMWFSVSDVAHCAKYLKPKIPAEHQDQTLFTRCDEWSAEYEGINAASPKWRLKGMISAVSEVVSCMSWPSRWERDVWEWAISPKHGEECPFFRYRERLDGPFRERLEALVRECDGFLYRCEETLQIVFVSTPDLPRIWRHQEHLADIARDQRFGFFHDASRPDYWKHMREPIAGEERLFTRQDRRAPLGRKLIDRLRRVLPGR